MPQRFGAKEKIGTLTNLGASVQLGPSLLTIGGQQYRTTTNLTVAYPAMTANTRYFIYAVQTAGVVSIVISTNVNSVGPSGVSAWKLVGAFYSNGITGNIAFGSFVNIEGVPVSQNVILFTPSGTLTTNTTYTGQYQINGRFANIQYLLSYTGLPTPGSQIFINMPTNLVMDWSQTIQDDISDREVGRGTHEDTGTQTYTLGATLATTTSFGLWIKAVATYLTNSGAYTASTPITIGNNDRGDMILENIPVSGFSAIPLKDL